MKKILMNAALILSSTLMIAPAFSHDPAEHAKTAEAPDCEVMKKMDHSNPHIHVNHRTVRTNVSVLNQFWCETLAAQGL